MPPLQQLLSFHIIEQDKNNQTLISWTYPTISPANKTLILSKVSFSNKTSFIYFRNKFEWIYTINTEPADADKLVEIKNFAVVIIAKDFNPDKYGTLCKILSKCYCKTGTPIELVKLYLSVYTTGSCSTQENGTFMIREFDNFNNNSTKLKELITMFGLEIILLYTAILLKKRVAIYHHSAEILLKWMPTVISLMNHRNANDFLFPLVELTSEDLLELKNNTWFVAGFKDSGICTKPEFYDLLINLAATEISITTHAKETLTMTKTHKDIAIFMVQLAENPEISETQIIKEIANKTQDLLNYLRSLSTKTAEGNTLTMDDIKNKNLHPSVENFLFNLAVAENLLSF